MNSSQHFILSFALSIFLAIAAALAVLLQQDMLNDWGVPATIVMLIVFVAVRYVVRWFFNSYVPVKCMFGCGRKAYPIPGRSDRFRCHSCGQDF